MSTWTCKRAVAAGLSALLLSGCLAAPDVARRDSGFIRKAPETVAVANKTVVIGGPPGYCIDRAASRLTGSAAFVLLGSCASITRDPRAGSPRVPGILTASVDGDGDAAPIGPPVLDQMAEFLSSPDGRAALARDGRAESVTVLDTLREQGALFVHLRDSSENTMAGMESDYWRGLFDVNGRLVTVSVVGFADRPLSVDAGLSTLRAFYARIRAETPTQTAQSSATPRAGFLKSLIR